MNINKLTLKQKILVAGTLFGMFFGAGNLIFPVHLGQMAGKNVIPAMIGFIITAVGIPILGVAAIGITHSDGLQTLSSKVGKGYGIFFTCILYLTIGPLFAIPRCATVSFTTGVTPMLKNSSKEWLGIIHHSEIHVNIGAYPAKTVENFGHPVHCNAGICRHAYGFILFFGYGGNAVFKVGVCPQKFPYIGHKLFPRGGK